MGARVTGESILIDRFPFDSDTPVWPVTSTELKRHIQIDHAADDLLLEDGTGGYLAAAVEYVEARGQVSLIHQQRQLLLSELPFGEAIAVQRGPLASVSEITYLDSGGTEQSLDANKYRVIAAGRMSSIYFDESLELVGVADGPGVVTVSMVCGFGESAGDVPAMWRQLVAEVAAHFYERRTGAAGGGLDPAMEAVWDRKITIAGGLRRYV